MLVSGERGEIAAPVGATLSRRRRLSLVDVVDTDAGAAGRHRGQPGGDAEAGVTELYAAHAVAMIRIALIMLGDRAAAEDVVQDAFFELR